MSYVDAWYDSAKDIVNVAERVNGKRVFVQYPAEYTFYYEDPHGTYKSIYGEPLSKFSTKSSKEFRREIKNTKHKPYESDLTPVSRCLSTHYRHAEAPKLHACFFDIETNFDKVAGFAPTDDPFNNITAITLFLDWVGELITLAMPPPSLTLAESQALVADIPNCYVFEDEVEMLDTFLNLIDDADVLSGWNSEGYDIPYTVNRIARVMSKNDTRRLCLWDRYPTPRTYERYGKEDNTYDTIGRVHMDYMQLYRKYTYEERHSYALDAIGEYEIDERKVPYEGSLDQLYNNDFRKFIEYNRQDVALLHKLDDKLKFLSLANQLAHENTVSLQKTMGAVAVTEQAIINEAHDRGLIMPDRQRDHGDDSQAAGAYVAVPKKGLHKWIGSIDINSLYPSVIRALNMSPETIVGQIRHTLTEPYIQQQMADVYDKKGKKRKGKTFAGAWEGLFACLEYDLVIKKDTSTRLTVDWEGSESSQLTGAQIYDIVFSMDSNLVLSANGTIFRLDKIGVVPGLLERWYRERKELQAVLSNWQDLNNGIAIPEHLL